MRKIWTVAATVGLALVAGACTDAHHEMADAGRLDSGHVDAGQAPDPVALVRAKFPECEYYIADDNPTVRNGIIRFDCGAAVDGPLYYLWADDGTLISACGGACFVPEQQDVCRTLCPPPQWEWPGEGASWIRFEIHQGAGPCPPGEVCTWDWIVTTDGSVQIDEQGTARTATLTAGDLSTLDALLASDAFVGGMKEGFDCDPPPTDIAVSFVLAFDDEGRLSQDVTGCVTSSTDTAPRRAFELLNAY